jgi:hypothetical protein
LRERVNPAGWADAAVFGEFERLWRTQSLVGTKAHFETTGFSTAVERYEVSFSGGASHISIDGV